MHVSRFATDRRFVTEPLESEPILRLPIAGDGIEVNSEFAAAPLRALLIASERPPIKSGVAESVGRLSAGLRARGHSVDVLAGTDGRSLTVGEFRFNNLALKWPAIRRTLSDYDVVNVHGPAPTISDAYLALLATVPRARRPYLVYTHHFSIDLPGWKRASQTYDRANRRLARAANRVVVTSESYGSVMTTRHGPPVEVIPWGVEFERFLGRPTRPPYDGSRPLRVLFVGQMREYKGINQLLVAVAGQKRLELTLVGTGRLEPTYRKLAMQCNVRHAGYVSDESLTEEFLNHDVVVMPSTSRLEAFGLALLEGMAAGCVPVASDLPGLRDVAAPTGRIVRAGDATHLRKTLLDLAAEPALVQRLQGDSRARAARYTWAATIDAYERAFANRTGPASTRGPSRFARRIITLPNESIITLPNENGSSAATGVPSQALSGSNPFP